ncbi:MAG: TIGR03086 family metal-binding protein [Phycicoccus sp.]
MTPDQPPAEEYRDIAARFTALVEGVPDDETWRSPSPVEGWSARDVVRHLVAWFPAFLESGTGIRLPAGPPVDNDPAAAWRTFSDAVQALLDDTGSASVVFSHIHTGELPLAVVVSRFFTADVFMHSWDLARATGQDETLDPARCAAMLAGMEPVEELMRSSGQYGPRIEVPDDADVQTRLLAFIGRRA